MGWNCVPVHMRSIIRKLDNVEVQAEKDQRKANSKKNNKKNNDKA